MSSTPDTSIGDNRSAVEKQQDIFRELTTLGAGIGMIKTSIDGLATRAETDLFDDPTLHDVHGQLVLLQKWCEEAIAQYQKVAQTV